MEESDLKSVLGEIKKTLNLDVNKVKNLPKMVVNVIPSGSYSLNEALGVGGFPKGRIVEIFGKPAGGKTLLSLLAIAEAQKMGDNAAFIDVEHAFDPTWAAKLGVDVPNLYFTQPDFGEQALEAVKLLVASGKFGIIVVDSVASLIPKAELEADLEQAQIAQLARMMSRALKILTEVVGKSQCCLIFINQVRVNPMQMFGDPETTPGGEALKFYSSVRLRVNKDGSAGTEIKEGTLVIGHRIKINVRKNKVAAPFREASFAIRYAGANPGVDRIDELATMAIDRDIVTLRGPSYTFGEGETAQKWMGKPAFLESLRTDATLQKAIEARLQETIQ